MLFQGPAAADLANVEALNRAFLSVLSRFSGIPGGAPVVDEELAGRLIALSVQQSARLAQCPFLLFSMAETDHRRWGRLFDSHEAEDLVDEMQRPPAALARLAAASVGFLWELSRRNPYAARLVSGAALQWCECLAESTPVRLFQFASREPELLLPRLATRRNFWLKLLGAGTNADEEIRHAAQIAALQTLLTGQGTEPYQPLAAAACRTTSPVTRVAERHRLPPES